MTTRTFGQFLDTNEIGYLDLLNYKLGDAITGLHFKSL
jgi:hypothetical protein